MKLVRLSLDDYQNISADDIGSFVYYSYLGFIWKYRILSVTANRVTLVTDDDEMHPKRYMMARNYMRFFKECEEN